MCQALVYLMGVYDCSKETKTPTLEELMFNKKENKQYIQVVSDLYNTVGGDKYDGKNKW